MVAESRVTMFLEYLDLNFTYVYVHILSIFEYVASVTFGQS